MLTVQLLSYLTTDHQSNLVTSKTREAPMKNRSLPPLEFTTTQVGAHLANYILKTPETINTKRTIIWLDNKVALQWVKHDNCKMPYVKKG